MARIFFIIARGERRLLDEVQESFREVPDVEVMVDRRIAERRRFNVRASDPGRRQTDRRINLFLDERLRAAGWTIARPLTPASD